MATSDARIVTVAMSAAGYWGTITKERPIL
jgi:hypothetical protein